MATTRLHDSARRHALGAAALAIGLLATVLFLIVLPADDEGWTIDEGTVVGALAVRLAVAVLLAGAIVVFLPLRRLADRIIDGLGQGPEPSPRARNVVSEIAIALQRPVERIVVHHSDVPNVGMFPGSSVDVVMVSSAAVDSLTRAELQALVAAQFAGMEDRWCRLATKAEIVVTATPIVAMGSVVLAIVGMAGGALAFGVGVLMVFLPRWAEQARDWCADVVGVATTYDPFALADAMAHLAELADRAHKVDVGPTIGPVSPFLVLPKRLQSRTTVGERTWTSTDEVRLELALRADRARAWASGLPPEDYTGKAFTRRWRQLGRTGSDR